MCRFFESLSHCYGRFAIQNLIVELLILLKSRYKKKLISQKFDKTKNNLIYAEMVKVLR